VKENAMHRSALTLAAVVALGVLAACPKENEPEPSRGGGEVQKKIALKAPAGTPKRPEGMSAIHVTHAGEISKQQVVEYFKTHNLPMNYTTTKDFHVDSVDLITAREVTDRLQGVKTGLADDERLAFVTLAGTFTFTGPTKSRPATFRRAYAVFDLKNGNLMMVGTLEGNADNAQTSTTKK
jgi:hypothetical protein